MLKILTLVASALRRASPVSLDRSGQRAGIAC